MQVSRQQATTRGLEPSNGLSASGTATFASSALPAPGRWWIRVPPDLHGEVARASAPVAIAAGNHPEGREHAGALPINPAALRPLELQYAIGPNELDDLADWLSFRTLRARWTTADGDTVGWAQLSLLGCSQSDVDAPDEDLTYAVVTGGSPAAADLASLLATTCGHPLAQVFVFGRHVARLDVLELRQDLCGRGLGAPLCNHLLDVVQREFAVVLFVLMPRPLGLDLEEPADRTPEVVEQVGGADGYLRRRDRIVRFCTGKLGTTTMPGSPEHQVRLGASQRVLLAGDHRCWWLQPDESRP